MNVLSVCLFIYLSTVLSIYYNYFIMMKIEVKSCDSYIFFSFRYFYK